MIERQDGNSLPTRKQIEAAMGRYQKLLDHHKISQDVQETVWVTILKQIEENPLKIVSEIQGYWETTFGTNGNGRVNTSSNTVGVSSVSNGNDGARLGPEVVIYNRRRNSRIKSFENSKEGSKIKASKKARKTNG